MLNYSSREIGIFHSAQKNVEMLSSQAHKWQFSKLLHNYPVFDQEASPRADGFPGTAISVETTAEVAQVLWERDISKK